jgi:PEP-CTERM motif
VRRPYPVSKVLLALVFVVLIAGSAAAAPITGQVWENVPAQAGHATIANHPVGPSNATFTTTDFNYQSQLTGYTIGGFLGNPVFTNTSGGFAPGDDLNNTYFLFTGQMFLNAGANLLSIGHDDGFELSIPGIAFDLSDPGPTSFLVSPFTATAPSAGFYNFTLSYGEVLGPPADLVFQLNNAPVGSPNVPEPSTLILFGVIGAGLAGRWLRRTTRLAS